MLQEYISNPKKLSSDVKDMVLSGEVNPLMVKVMFDIFSDAMKDKDVRDAIMNEADLHGAEIEVNGFKYMKSSRRSYSYNHDALWQELSGKIKAREAQMKTAIEHEVVDTGTGELVPSAEAKSSEFLKRC